MNITSGRIRKQSTGFCKVLFSSPNSCIKISYRFFKIFFLIPVLIIFLFGGFKIAGKKNYKLKNGNY